MIIQGDSLSLPLKDESVQCCVTSPPYYGLRDYGTAGQIGLEKTPEEYTQKLVQVFREVWRVLKKDGVVFLNLGDSYTSTAQGTYNAPERIAGSNGRSGERGKARKQYRPFTGLKPKDLIGIPWRVAFALQGDGWWLRQDIIWHKPNPMPESVTDRCTKSHEYVFLLTKSAKYYYNQAAIKEPIKDSSAARLIQDIENQEGSGRVVGKTNGNMKAVVGAPESWHGSSFDRGKTGEAKHTRGGLKPVLFGGNKQCPDTRLQSGKEWNPKMAGGGSSFKNGHSGSFDKDGNPLCGLTANKKSVWTITTKPFKAAHFAVMPEKLVEPCILAGSRPGDIILDPFSGAGTVGVVAEKHGRKFVGVELNQEYIKIAAGRIAKSASQPDLFIHFKPEAEKLEMNGQRQKQLFG